MIRHLSWARWPHGKHSLDILELALAKQMEALGMPIATRS